MWDDVDAVRALPRVVEESEVSEISEISEEPEKTLALSGFNDSIKNALVLIEEEL